MGEIKFVFPNLYNISLSIVSIPDTQDSVEKLFSVLNGFITKSVPDYNKTYWRHTPIKVK